MAMIIDELEEITENIKKVNNRVKAYEHAKAQKSIDDGYNNLALLTTKQISDLIDLKTDTGFNVSENLLGKLYLLVANLLEYDASNPISRDTEISLENDKKEIDKMLTSEWTYFYNKYVGQTISMLKLFEKIGGNNVSECMNDIKSAESWGKAFSQRKKLVNGKEKAEKIIDDLNVDDNVTNFFRLVNSGRATLRDINDSVFKWLKEHNIDDKIRISFA